MKLMKKNNNKNEKKIQIHQQQKYDAMFCLLMELSECVCVCLLTWCIDANFSTQALRVIADGRVGGKWLVCDIVITISVCHCLHQ